MRVLFNTYPVAFDCPGGGEVQLLHSRSALQRAGVQVLLFDPWQPQFDAVDLVHYFSVQGGSMNFCSHVQRRGLPLVVSPILWLTPAGIPNYPMDEIRSVLRLCDAVLPNSRAEAEQLAEHFGVPREKFHVTHNGVEPVFAEPADGELFRRRFGIEGRFVLNVANVEPRKNQLALVRALRGLELPLVIAGRIRDVAYWQACRREGGDFLRHVGPVEHGSDLHRSAYRACSVFALPSTLETPGLAALEAAAQGARVVITQVGSTREYFGSGADYVDPGDEANIRQAVLGALERPARPELGKHLAAKYSWDRTARQLLGAYEQMLAQRAP